MTIATTARDPRSPSIRMAPCPRSNSERKRVEARTLAPLGGHESSRLPPSGPAAATERNANTNFRAEFPRARIARSLK